MGSANSKGRWSNLWQWQILLFNSIKCLFSICRAPVSLSKNRFAKILLFAIVCNCLHCTESNSTWLQQRSLVPFLPLKTNSKNIRRHFSGTALASRLGLVRIYANTQTQLCIIYCIHIYNIHSIWIRSKDIIFVHTEHINLGWHISRTAYEVSYYPKLFNI